MYLLTMVGLKFNLELIWFSLVAELSDVMSPIAGETVMSRLGLGLPPSALHSTVVFSPATLTSGTDANIILVGLVATVTFCKIGHDEIKRELVFNLISSSGLLKSTVSKGYNYLSRILNLANCLA